MSTSTATPSRQALPHPHRTALVAGLTAVLLLSILLSLALGSRFISPVDIIATLSGDAPGQHIHNAIFGVRIPRTAVGLATGAALGLSGALMQALTRNPLADPGILGVSAGAAFGIVVAISVFSTMAMIGYIWFALLGALIASVTVYLLGNLGQSGLTPVKLALSGVAITVLLSSITSAMVLNNLEVLNRFRFWAAGSLIDATFDQLAPIAPFLIVGAILAIAAGPSLNSLALGEDVAKALGRRIGLVRVAGVLSVTLLTGASVAAIGPIVFIGLVVPHVARALVVRAGLGPDNRWILPMSAVLAACLMLLADVAGRLIAAPVEVQAGILVAFVGGPFFIALVRSRRLAEV